MPIDDTDRRLLRQLLATPEAPSAELADRSGLSTGTYFRRLEKLREAGVLRGVRARIDWAALGYGVMVSLRITLDKTEPNAFDTLIAAAREVPEVIEIQTFLGQVDLRLGVIARNMSHYQEVYRSRILTLPHIADIEALMHVATLKSSESLPL